MELIAVDGTKVHANASHDATREYGQIAGEILADADAVDREEEESTGSSARRTTPMRPTGHAG